MLDKHALLLEITFNHINLSLWSSCNLKIVHSLLIDREVTHSRSVLGGHICDGRPVCQSERLDSWPVELNELAYDSSFSKHFDAGQHEVSGCGVLGQRPSESETNDLWQDHGNCLTKHNRFSFNTADTPANNTESIDHGCVGVCAHHRIVVEEPVSLEDDSGKVLEVDLMNNTGAWWHNLEIVECL